MRENIAMKPDTLIPMSTHDRPAWPESLVAATDLDHIGSGTRTHALVSRVVLAFTFAHCIRTLLLFITTPESSALIVLCSSLRFPDRRDVVPLSSLTLPNILHAKELQTA